MDSRSSVQRRLHDVHSCERPKDCENSHWYVSPFHDIEYHPAIYDQCCCCIYCMSISLMGKSPRHRHCMHTLPTTDF